MVYEGEQQGAEVIAKKLIGTAVKKLFDAKFPAPDSGRPTRAAPPGAGRRPTRSRPARRRRARMPPPEKIHPLYEPIVAWFAAGNRITLSDDTPFAEHSRRCSPCPDLKKAVEEHFAPALRRRSSRSAWSSSSKA